MTACFSFPRVGKNVSPLVTEKGRFVTRQTRFVTRGLREGLGF